MVLLAAGPNSKYLERINDLKLKLQSVQSEMQEAVEKQRIAERDSANKDKVCNENCLIALERNFGQSL